MKNVHRSLKKLRNIVFMNASNKTNPLITMQTNQVTERTNQLC